LLNLVIVAQIGTNRHKVPFKLFKAAYISSLFGSSFMIASGRVDDIHSNEK